MSRTPVDQAVAVLPLELGGSLRILTEDVDLTRGTVRWQLRGPHITGVVWLAREDSHEIGDKQDPEAFRCRLYSGDSTGRLDRHNDVIRENRLTCYRAVASPHHLGNRATHPHTLAQTPIPDLNWITTAADRRTADVRRALARHALAAAWLAPLRHTWRLQTAVTIAARAAAEHAKALGQIQAATANLHHAQVVLHALAADTTEAHARGIRPLTPYGLHLRAPRSGVGESRALHRGATRPVTPIDSDTIAARLAADGDRTPNSGTVGRSGLQLAQAVERLIDSAALAGAFADLADRPSIEVSTLIHSDRTVWLCFEFDRDRQLLRAGPVPVTEVAGGDLSTAEGIAAALGRIRHLMATAILLNHRPLTAPAPLDVSLRASRSRTPALALTGPAITGAVLESARAVCLDGVEDPNGPAWHLGRALAGLKANPPSRAQTTGPDPLSPGTEDTLDRIAQAEHDLLDLIGTPDIRLNLFTAAGLVTGIVRAIAAGASAPGPGPISTVAIACTKRREVCEDQLASIRRAQQFVHERAGTAPRKKAVRLRRRISRVNTAAVQHALMAVLLSDLAENAEAHGEPYCAHAADTAAAGFEAKLVRTHTDAWNAAVDALHQTVEPDEHAAIVSAWERTTGGVFAGNWRRD